MRACRPERRGQDHAAAADLRRAAARRGHGHHQRRPRRDAPVRRVGARRQDGPRPAGVRRRGRRSGRGRGRGRRPSSRSWSATTRAARWRYAQALTDWARRGRLRRGDGVGHRARWPRSACPYEQAQWRGVATLSGGEQKRLVLEALLRGPDEVLLLDEPDNYLDVPGKRWLEEQLRRDRQDRAVRLARPGTARPGGDADRQRRARARRRPTSWVHGGGFATLPRGAGAPHRAVRGTAPPLGRGARAAQGARARRCSQ